MSRKNPTNPAHNICWIEYPKTPCSWRVKFVRRKRVYQKFFRCSHFGGVGKALEKAIEFRDHKITQLPPRLPQWRGGPKPAFQCLKKSK
jgi:hypothetical protein